MDKSLVIPFAKHFFPNSIHCSQSAALFQSGQYFRKDFPSCNTVLTSLLKLVAPTIRGHISRNVCIFDYLQAYLKGVIFTLICCEDKRSDSACLIKLTLKV